jgi:hypothetical protein
MIILTTDTEQTFSIIPNGSSFEILNAEFKNETTQVVYTFIEVNFNYSKDLVNLIFTDFDYFEENNFYTLKIHNGDNINGIIYKDRVFCTNQPKSSYSINNGDYTLPNIDNNFYKI